MRPLLLLSFLFFSTIALSQDIPLGKGPLEITANEALEWQRNENRLIARGNARAVQDDKSVTAQTLEASYIPAKSDERGGMTLTHLRARGGVIIIAGAYRATGRQAHYDIALGQITMEGPNLHIIMPDSTLHARDSFTYDIPSARFTAKGDVRLDRKDGESIEAQEMTALLHPDSKTGALTLAEVDAIGNVTVTQGKSVLHGPRAHLY